MKNKLYPVISFFLILFSWQALVSLLKTPAFILPAPLAVGRALLQDAAVLQRHAAVTLAESVIGLAIAAAVAFVTALVMDRWHFFNTALYPLLVLSQSLPIIVLGPLLTLWFGFGFGPKILLVILMSYFPIVVAFFDGLKKTSSAQIMFLQTMGASSWQIYRVLKIPTGMTGFFSGLKVAATYCVGGAVIGEWLSAEAGLGYYMIRVKNGYQIDKVFAAIFCVVVLSLVLNGAVSLLRRGYYRVLYKKEG